MALAASAPLGPWSALAPVGHLVKDFLDLKRLEQADIRRREREERAQQKAILAAARRERRQAAWPRWTAWWERRASELKTAATVAGSVGVIVTGTVKAVQNAGAIWHTVRRAWSFYADRGVEAPASPARDGERLAPDRVERSRLPLR